jgi:hypothetical protein
MDNLLPVCGYRNIAGESMAKVDQLGRDPVFSLRMGFK